MSDMDQADIDALLSGAAAASEDPAPAPGGEVDQASIDALFAGGGDGGGGGGEVDQGSIDALFDGGGGGGGGEVDQGSIDALFDGGGGGGGGEVDQGSIDALFDGGGGGGGGEVDQANIDALFDGGGGGGGEVDQGSIDSLFDSVGTPDQGSIDALFEGAQDTSSDDMESLLAEIQNDPSLGQTSEEVNINELLTEIQTDTALAADTGVAQDDIESLIGSVQAQTGVPGVASAVAVQEEEGVNVDFLLDMELTLTFEVGRAKMMIGDLLSLGQGSVIELHRLVGEDLDMFVSGRLIAKGEVVVVNEKFGVRILNIISPEERIVHMSGMDKMA